MTKKRKNVSRAPTDVDKLVGQRIREARLSAGLTLTGLGELLGISHQQLQKYEVAGNRVSAGMLQSISDALKLPIQSFTKPTSPPVSNAAISRRERCSQKILLLKNTEDLRALERIIDRFSEQV